MCTKFEKTTKTYDFCLNLTVQTVACGFGVLWATCTFTEIDPVFNQNLKFIALAL